MEILLRKKQITKSFAITLLFIFILSCGSTQKSNIKNTLNCSIVKNDKITIPEIYKESKNNIIQKFIGLDNGLQVLKIKTSQGYDFKQDVVLYSSQDNEDVFSISDGNTETKSTIKTSDIINILNNFNKGSIVGVCDYKSSLKETTEYYFKNNSTLAFSIVLSSGRIKDFEDTEFSKELDLLKYFQ